MPKERISIDMDDVMTDAVSRFIDLYQQKFNEDLSALRNPGSTLQNTVPPDRLAAVMQFPHQKEFFKDLQIKEDCQEVIRQLQEKYDIYVVTAAMEFELCFTDKFNWLKEHLPFIPWTNLVFCGHKSIICTEYLIDDAERNLKSFTGTPLVFTAPNNAHLTEYTRFNTWQDVAAYFLK